jgi:DNA invertase Pin-like site-specific DNA recombinase
VKPLIYGYMRLRGDEPESDIRQMELVLKDYAEREGYCLATIFYEEDNGTRSAFEELIEELKRSEAHCVIVPAIEHLSGHALLRISMIVRLEEMAGASVLTLSDRA